MTGQNTSTAVMQRRIEPHDSLDDYPTPLWATRALCERVLGEEKLFQYAWEPACNRGHMVHPLKEYFSDVWASDIYDYGFDGMNACEDFLLGAKGPPFEPHWIITNPPFRLAEQFIVKGISQASIGVAVIVRSAFLEGIGRYENLFKENPPNIIAQFCERVPMVKGRLTSTGSTATAYTWLVWDKRLSGTKFMWIPKCRHLLERKGDYPA